MVQTRCTRNKFITAFLRDTIAYRLHKLTDMLFRCTATAAHDIDTEVLHKMRKILRQLFRSQMIMCVSADIFRDAGIRHDKNRLGTDVRKCADMLGHFFRTGCTIDTNDVNIVRFDTCQCRRDFRTKQHCSHRFDSNRNDDR